MKKVIFIDIDGTLVGFDSKAPQTAIDAIRQTRKNGNLVFICTGRSNPEILPSIRDIGFDGIIGAGGAYIEIDNQVVKHETLPESTVRELLELFRKEKIGCYLETNNGLFSNDYCISSIHDNLLAGLPDTPEVKEKTLSQVEWFTSLLKDMRNHELEYNQINKICFINKNYPFESIERDFGEKVELHHSTIPQYGQNSGEAGVKNQDKYAAITFVLDYLDLDKTDSIGLGDGDNDIAMFSAVGLGIAMANGTDKLKAVADDVTDAVDEDGLAKAFNKYELI